ncbi:MAG: peptidase S41 [Flavobacteriales bacterium]|nr:peptidase S41 [Flavobacteriales bacterium]|tara:strand:- start:26716 stop:28368 length:1653 start_codon:yes stop_codon:yes gene_type:complete
MKKLKKYLILSISIFLLTSFVTNYFEISKNLEIFNNIYREINSYYVDPVDPGELMHSTIDTMLKRLDPYTKYIPESEVEDFRFQTTGEYGGIGSTIRKIDKNVVIYEPYKNFPADKAGLKMGDVLIEIEGEEINDASVQDVSNLLKGTPGTSVSVKVLRKENLTKNINIIREKIQVPSVPYSGILRDDIGYVKLKRFTKNCSKEVEEAINKLIKKQNLKGLIIDLRSNPGGLLNESIRMSNLFINKNETVVTTSGKNVEWEKTYTTKQEPKYPEIPIVILVNESSASASEIVAGAIQDLDRGVIIGNKTFGKGLVQQSRNLSYNSRLKVTVAKYYTPSGRCIQDLIKTQNYNSYLDIDTSNQTDSLRNKFFTKNGREVYDGGGIDPDIKVKRNEFPEILWPLLRDNYIFKFGNNVNYNLTENQVNEFNLPDSIYNQFTNYLEEVGFNFTANNEFIIENIEQEINELSDIDFNLEGIQIELETLKEQIQINKKKDIQKYKSEISKQLSEHLITRYFYEAGRIEYQLEGDPYVDKALMILSNADEYANILAP